MLIPRTKYRKVMQLIKLTPYAAKGGCACKLGPHILNSVLQSVKFPTNEYVLTAMGGAEDAGVYVLSDDVGMVQTVDFFTPVVDEPYMFGRIAAANSLSDVYAMGGRPLTALNIVGFPVPLVEAGALTEVLKGAMEILEEAGVVVLGGHSIENETPVFGLAVTGQVNSKAVWQNGGAREGDVLVLTKALGTGIMSTALKGGLFPAGTEAAVASMSSLNKTACEVAQNFTIHACTDITGFSLMGHGSEMAASSGVSLEIDTAKLPLFPHVAEAAEMGLVPAATYGNRKAVTAVAGLAELAPVWSDICFDPQTSGGLLLAIPATEAEELVKSLRQSGVSAARVIGKVVARGDFDVYVR